VTRSKEFLEHPKAKFRPNGGFRLYCIYCNENHGEGTPFSDEHIVPRALGGLNSFTIRVCGSSNNDLGNRVDSPFISMFPVNSDRFFLDLQSHRGKPTLNLSGTAVIDGKDQVLKNEIRRDDKVFKIFRPSVEVAKTDDQEQLKVSGDPMDVKRILLGKLASAEKEGKTVRDEHGNLLTRESIEAMIVEKSITHESFSVLMTLQIDSYDAVRFFCKMALAAGFHEFGEPFGSSGVAQKLRLAMVSTTNADVVLPGIFWPLVDNDRELYRFFKVPDAHVLAFLPMENKPLIITLFGGRYTAAIPLQDDSSQSSVPIQEGRVFQIDLKAKQLKVSSYEKYILQRPWIQKPASD
jgi:HNH endonuclease